MYRIMKSVGIAGAGNNVRKRPKLCRVGYQFVSVALHGNTQLETSYYSAMQQVKCIHSTSMCICEKINIFCFDSPIFGVLCYPDVPVTLVFSVPCSKVAR